MSAHARVKNTRAIFACVVTPAEPFCPCDLLHTRVENTCAILRVWSHLPSHFGRAIYRTRAEISRPGLNISQDSVGILQQTLAYLI